MDDLIAFLRARLDEREQAAKGAEDEHPSPWVDRDGTVDDSRQSNVVDWTTCADHLVLNDPARVLVEVDAKRRHIDWLIDVRRVADKYPRDEAYIFAAGLAEKGLKMLALPDAGHPDYREEWKP